MIIWFILLAFAVFLFFLLKFEHTVSRTKLIVIMVVFLLFLLSLFAWISMNDVSFDSPRAVINSVMIYVDWAKQVGLSVFNGASGAVSTVGNAIRGNSTKVNVDDGRK